MGELLVARRHFDRAMAIREGHGPERDALEAFTAATDTDDSMADAWLGRVSCGDTKLDTLKALYANSDWLHRETSRLGTSLTAHVQMGPHLAITVADAAQVGLALVSALTAAGEYDQAETLLSSKKLHDGWGNLQWHQLARAYLHSATQRWPDVLTAAGEELPAQATIMGAVTASICALTASAAAHLGQGRVDWTGSIASTSPGRAGPRSGSAPTF